VTRVLAVLDAGDRAPSGIVRGLIYKDLFREHGFDVEYMTRLPLKMMDLLDEPPRLLARVLQRPGVRRRLLDVATVRSERRILERAKHVDIVYMSKVLSAALVRELRKQTTARLVLDFGDAIWFYPSMDELGEMLQTVDAVTTDNEYTADYIRRYTTNCWVVPDCAQVELFDSRRAELRRSATDTITLGWIGSPGTAYNLYVVWEALERLAAKHPHVTLRLVGPGRDERWLPPFERVKYSVRPWYDQRTMIEEIFAMDIGLFPLQDVEKCRVRGILKAAVYMSGEVPVVASPVGQVTSFIQDGENGLLARSTDEWVDKLDALIGDADLRRRLAARGLETVRAELRLEQSFAKLAAVLRPVPNHARS
jgi:glycosyltransferase involved in cell wall biosynthesis